MKEQAKLAKTLHRETQPLSLRNTFQNEIDTHKKLIQQIKANHEQKVKHSQHELKQ